MKIGDLFVRLGVQADTFTVRDFTKAIGDIPLSVASAITSLTGLSVGFLELTKNTLDMTNSLGVFHAQTGLSIEELQRWQAVAQQAGVSGQSVESAVLRISNAMAQLKLGHMDQNFMLALGQLGVSPKGNAFDILGRIMEATKRHPAAVSAAALANMGISPDMMRIFSLSPGQFNKMASVGPVMDEAQMRQMQAFQQSLAEFSHTIEKEFVPILIQLEPTIRELAQVLTALLKTGGPVVASSLGKTVHLANAFGHGRGMETMYTEGHRNFHDSVMRSVHHVVNNITQHIHSTADPEEVAAIAHRHFKREKQNATKQFNNAGH